MKTKYLIPFMLGVAACPRTDSVPSGGSETLLENSSTGLDALDLQPLLAESPPAPEFQVPYLKDLLVENHGSNYTNHLGSPVGEYVPQASPLAAGDIDGDGIVEVIACNLETYSGEKGCVVFEASDFDLPIDDQHATLEKLVTESSASDTGYWEGVGLDGQYDDFSGEVTFLSLTDLDNNGHLDLIVADALEAKVRVYMQEEGGNFSYSSTRASVQVVSMLALDLDYDNDLDLLFTDRGSLQFWENRDGAFPNEQQTIGSGADLNTYALALVNGAKGEEERILVDLGASFGEGDVQIEATGDGGYRFDSDLGSYQEDPLLFPEDMFWQNSGSKHCEVNLPCIHPMGAASGTLRTNREGSVETDLAFFVATEYHAQVAFVYDPSTGTFSDKTEALALRIPPKISDLPKFESIFGDADIIPTEYETLPNQLPWGTAIADVNGDGYSDLILANGNTNEDLSQDLSETEARDSQVLVFLYDPIEDRYRDSSEELGTLNHPGDYFGLCVDDVNGDVVPDLLVGGLNGDLPRVFVNSGVPGNHYLALELFDEGGQRVHPTGTEIEVLLEGRDQPETYVVGGSYSPSMGCTPKASYIGLGARDQAEKVIVRWSSGGTQEIDNLPSGQQQVFREI